MNIVLALRRKWHYSVEQPGAGCLRYRAGNHEYTFPIFQDGDDLVLVGRPSSQRIYFFFNAYPHHAELAEDTRRAIVDRITGHLRSGGTRVRILDRDDGAGERFDFHPELFDHRNRAAEVLARAGYECFSEFSGIDAVHDDFGLEVSGIRNDADVKPILDALRGEFPHWHHYKCCLHEEGRDQGWSVILTMFPPRARGAEWRDGD